jgi:hypothetical protein
MPIAQLGFAVPLSHEAQSAKRSLLANAFGPPTGSALRFSLPNAGCPPLGAVRPRECMAARLADANMYCRYGFLSHAPILPGFANGFFPLPGAFPSIPVRAASLFRRRGGRESARAAGQAS